VIVEVVSESAMSAIDTAASGLYAAALQLNVYASNLANAQTTGSLPQTPSTPAASAIGAVPASSLSPTASTAAPPLAYQPLQLVQYSNADVAGGGVSASVQPSSPAAYAAYSPSSSYADANGQVAAPAIDLPAQIANQASALIQFQANLKVILASDQMQKSVLDQSA
jgi:flagellar basal-body rod protein FlgC